MAKSGLATLRRRNTLMQEDYRSAVVGPEHCFPPALLLPAFQPARLCLADSMVTASATIGMMSLSNCRQPAFASSAAPKK
jgi:hypothetical protein